MAGAPGVGGPRCSRSGVGGRPPGSFPSSLSSVRGRFSGEFTCSRSSVGAAVSAATGNGGTPSRAPPSASLHRPPVRTDQGSRHPVPGPWGFRARHFLGARPELPRDRGVREGPPSFLNPSFTGLTLEGRPPRRGRRDGGPGGRILPLSVRNCDLTYKAAGTWPVFRGGRLPD